MSREDEAVVNGRGQCSTTRARAARRLGSREGRADARVGLWGRHRAAAEDVEQVALRDAVEADAERKARGDAEDLGRDVLADAEHDRVRVLLVSPPVCRQAAG